MRARRGYRLQPDPARSGELGEKDAVPAEELVADPGHRRQLEVDCRLEQAEMAGVGSQLLSRLEVELDDLTVQLDEGTAFAGQLLQEEPLAAEDADAELLLHEQRQVDAFLTADEAVTVDGVLTAAVERELPDLPGGLGRERDVASRPRRVPGHEERSAAESPFRSLQEASLLHTGVAPGLEVHLTAEPGELPRLGDHRLTAGKRHGQNRRGWTCDLSLHQHSSRRRYSCNVTSPDRRLTRACEPVPPASPSASAGRGS